MGRKLSQPEPLLMTELQHDVIEKLANRPTTTLKMSTRANILLQGYEGTPYSIISKNLKIALNTVKLWEERWTLHQEALSELETEADLTKGMLLFFSDLPRSGKPKKFTDAQEKQIVALACDHPNQHNIEMTNWTNDMLALTAQAKGIVESISPGQVARILKNKPITTP